MFRAQGKIAEREHNNRAWLAWHIGFLSRVNPKKFPKLEKLLYRARGGKKRQTPEEMLAIVKMITVAHGGEVKLKAK